MKKRKGFTLIELLVVSAIVVLVFFVIYKAVGSGSAKKTNPQVSYNPTALVTPRQQDQTKVDFANFVYELAAKGDENARAVVEAFKNKP